MTCNTKVCLFAWVCGSPKPGYDLSLKKKKNVKYNSGYNYCIFKNHPSRTYTRKKNNNKNE